VFSASTNGGLAEHIFYQARELSRSGHEVLVVAPKGFLKGRRLEFSLKQVLLNMPAATKPTILRKGLQAIVFCFNYFILSFYIIARRPQLVLFDSYREYLAMFWSWSVKLASLVSGAICVVNIHDPVRDYIIGPRWWHNWNIALGYSFVNIGLVHSAVPDAAQIPGQVRLVEVPVGVYDLPAPVRGRVMTRNFWKARIEHFVYLSFGFIRDNKNIDLLIRALQNRKEAFLVVAGKSQSSNDKPVKYYRELAEELQVQDRCFFHEGFISEEEVGDYFSGADFVALTYGASFHSQSGVLNLAAAARLPILASGAESPLINAVKRFDLGVVINPDSVEAIEDGMSRLINRDSKAMWNEYHRFAGWESNVSKLWAAFELFQRKRSRKDK
jgi:glycosyltransferase involved in cell wall biosynthesis